MKIAIVLSGEYRTFSWCRHTMPFIDDLDNDIYVITWDKSVLKNTYLDIDITEDITLEKIKSDVARNITEIEICNSSEYINVFPNQLKMIHCWYKGLQLVKNSGKDYDFIYILRPDMFFNTTIERMKLNEAAEKWDKNIFYCDISPGAVEGRINLNDFMFLGSPNILNDLITENLEIDFCKDNSAVNGTLNWHYWWFDLASAKYEIKRVPHEIDFSVLGRPRPNVMNWGLAKTYSDMWLNSQIAEHIQQGGVERAEKNWDRQIIEDALININSRIYIK